MEFKGKISAINQNFISGGFDITFHFEDRTALAELDGLKDMDLSVKAVRYRKQRSLDANKMLWACIGEIANVLNADKWKIYLNLLRRYGQFTYIVVKPKAVESVKAQWRECEELGEIEINGEKGVQMLCYFGSHTYNTKEFSKLLEGTVDEMKALGIQPPPSEEMQRSLELWQKN